MRFDAEVLGRMNNKTTPAAADIQKCFARLQPGSLRQIISSLASCASSRLVSQEGK